MTIRSYLGVLVVILALLLPASLFAGGQQEEVEEDVEEVECHNPPGMDDRYCDRTGDMMADPPLDEDEWVDPNVLIFSYSPTEDPAVYEDAWADFVTYLENELGRPVQWFGVQTYAAQVEAMRAGRLHVSGFAAGAVQDAVNEAGFRPQTVMQYPDGSVGYYMEIWSHQDGDIETMEDLEGREIAFVSESSNSGYFAPRALLYDEYGWLPGEDYEVTFSGSHDNSALGVYNRDYEAAPLASTVMDRAIDGGRIPPREEFANVLYESAEFPTTAYGVAHNLHPDLQEQIREAFLNFDWEDTTLLEEFAPRNEFTPASYEEDWEVMRTIRARSDEVAEILGE